MKRIRITAAAAAAGVAAAALLFGGAFRGESSDAGVHAVSSASSESFQAGFALGNTAFLVQQLQAELRLRASAAGYATLGLAYQQRARETGDPTYYTKSDGVLRRALALEPKNATAVSGLGSLALSRHRFRTALALGRKALVLQPDSVRNYGIVGDALVELGRYRAAFGTFDTMARTKPGLSAYARVSNGVKTDLETALFDVDHGIGLRHALALARAAHRDRPSIDADDVLAWALARNGRCGEALIYSRRALRLGTRDALKFFHRGQIERCLGHAAAARAWLERAVSLNPHFSIVWGPVARRELR